MATPTTTTTPRRRGVLAALYAGLVLTVGATVAPYVDRATSTVLADHVRDGYPDYSTADVDRAVTTWLVVLTTVGVLALAGWVASIRAVTAERPWARWAVTAVVAAGTSLGLSALLVEDTSGEVGLAPVLGVIGMLPWVAGLVAVALLWSPSIRGGLGGGTAGRRPTWAGQH